MRLDGLASEMSLFIVLFFFLFNKIFECPYCHSMNTSKIGTVSRMTSTAMFGLASKKIGKQWHCNNCGSDF